MEIISLPRICILRGFFLANHLTNTDNLTRTIKRQNKYKRNVKSGPNKQQKTLKKTYVKRQTFYDTRPGNGACLFFQLWSTQAQNCSTSKVSDYHHDQVYYFRLLHNRHIFHKLLQVRPGLLQVFQGRIFGNFWWSPCLGGCPSCHLTNSENTLKALIDNSN